MKCPPITMSYVLQRPLWHLVPSFTNCSSTPTVFRTLFVGKISLLNFPSLQFWPTQLCDIWSLGYILSWRISSHFFLMLMLMPWCFLGSFFVILLPRHFVPILHFSIPCDILSHTDKSWEICCCWKTNVRTRKPQQCWTEKIVPQGPCCCWCEFFIKKIKRRRGMLRSTYSSESQMLP